MIALIDQPGDADTLVARVQKAPSHRSTTPTTLLPTQAPTLPNEALVDFCKTLENTGCGYYPNSSFVHVDVRAPGTGHVAWIDTSGPGEPPHYVASWPPPPEPAVNLAREDSDPENLNGLPPLPGQTSEKDELKTPAASVNAPLKLKEWE